MKSMGTGLPCGLEIFEINNKEADIEDFGGVENFAKYWDKLREKYCSGSSNCTLTVFQTETSNSNEKSLTNNVKYVVYDGNNTQLDLSVCQDEKININYALKENSNLNLTMYSEFSNKGIDILNSSDSFFNDICYSYSDGTSDMILSDRIAEIYQNYSLCDSGCDYEGINMDDSTVLIVFILLLSGDNILQL